MQQQIITTIITTQLPNTQAAATIGDKGLQPAPVHLSFVEECGCSFVAVTVVLIVVEALVVVALIVVVALTVAIMLLFFVQLEIERLPLGEIVPGGQFLQFLAP